MVKAVLVKCLFVVSLLVLMVAPVQAEPRYKAVAFDYFVLFNPNSVVPVAEAVFPGKGLDFVKAWRGKQFEYGFLRSITDSHEDFFKVTQDALDYTLTSQGLTITDAQKADLMNAYLNLELWPDAKAGLQTLRDAGVKIITIANLSPTMVQTNADKAGITDMIDVLMSTAENSTYKPDPRAYALGVERLGLPKEDIAFAAFGGWDAYGAAHFGYPTVWVNRFNLPPENLGVQADVTTNNFQGLLDFVLGEQAAD